MWDYLGFKEAKKARSFTQYPHLTIGIRVESLAVRFTLPNGMNKKIRNQTLGETFDVFESTIRRVLNNMEGIMKMDKSVKPILELNQSHSPSGSSSIRDASLFCDLRTAFRKSKSSPEKYQPEWLKTAYHVMMNKGSNLQLQIGVDIPYKDSTMIKTPKAVRLIKKALLALEPLLNSWRKAI